MATGIPLKKFLKPLNHDGSEIWWPNRKEPFCRRSFHIQEMIDVAHDYDYRVMEIHRIPLIGHNDEERRQIFDLDICMKRWEYYLMKYSGVLVGEKHAVAWDSDKIYNPNGLIQNLDDFNAHTFFMLFKI